MKRQVQQAGVRKYFGDDLVGLHGRKPFAAIDAFFAEHGPHHSGMRGYVKFGGGTTWPPAWSHSTPGCSEVRDVMVMPFRRCGGFNAPLLSAQRQAFPVSTATGESKPIAYDYKGRGFGRETG